MTAPMSYAELNWKLYLSIKINNWVLYLYPELLLYIHELQVHDQQDVFR